MKIIDWEKKGNLVRLYLGDDDLEHWYGDDWNDAPYEANAGAVYDRFIKAHKDFVLPLDTEAVEWAENLHNPPVSKQELRVRQLPFLKIETEGAPLLLRLGDLLDPTQRFILGEVSLCSRCGCTTHTLLTECLGTTLMCGKCGERK